jgi:hypothetical protein
MEMFDPLPPPLSRARKKAYDEDARALKSTLEGLLAELDDALGIAMTSNPAAA